MARKIPTREMSLDCLRSLVEIKEKMEVFQLTYATEEAYLRVDDPFPKSDYFFQVVNVRQNVHHQDASIVYVDMEMRPGDAMSSKAVSNTVHINDFALFFDSWAKRVQIYSVYFNQLIPDTIEIGYEEEYAAKVEFIDDDMDTHSYDETTQTEINVLLNKVAERLKRYKDESALEEDVKAEIDIILRDIERLIAHQTRQTKRQVSKSIIRILAKCRKWAPQIVRELSWDLVKTLLVEAAQNPTKYLQAAERFLAS